MLYGEKNRFSVCLSGLATNWRYRSRANPVALWDTVSVSDCFWAKIPTGSTIATSAITIGTIEKRPLIF
jgi:hypothetical protein